MILELIQTLDTEISKYFSVFLTFLNTFQTTSIFLHFLKYLFNILLNISEIQKTN